jgi:hypothetical protein
MFGKFRVSLPGFVGSHLHGDGKKASFVPFGVAF